jgi:uncharacterized membrane protein YczE
VRLVSLVFGLFLFALGIVLTLESHLGLWPWDVLHQGIAHHTPLSFGEANAVVGVFVLLVAWMLGGPPGLGTIANATLIGLFIQVMTGIGAVESLADQGLAVRIGLLAAGIALAGPGSAFYIGADLGAGPRDTLMLVGAQRTGRRVGDRTLGACRRDRARRHLRRRHRCVRAAHRAGGRARFLAPGALAARRPRAGARARGDRGLLS